MIDSKCMSGQKQTWHLPAAFGLALVSLFASACDRNALDDFDDATFCDAGPCDWDVLSGKTSLAPTWHPEAEGISLDEPGTSIERRTLSYRSGCVVLRVTALVEPGADLRLTVRRTLGLNQTFTVPTGAYKPYDVRLPRLHESDDVYATIAGRLLTLTKQGSARVVIGNVALVPSDHCTVAPIDAGMEPPPAELPLGSICEESDECISGDCATTTLTYRYSLNPDLEAETETGLCTDCASAGTCPIDALCDQHNHCASDACINGRCGCTSDAECGGGLYCTRGLCSPCRDDSDCAAGEHCGFPASPVALPKQCQPAADVALKRSVAIVCDRTEQCLGLECGGSEGIPQRCGTACRLDDVRTCADGETCVVLYPLSFTDEQRAHLASLDPGARWSPEDLPEDEVPYQSIYLYLAQPAVCVPE